MKSRHSHSKAIPATEEELGRRVVDIAGKTLAQLANEVHWPVPDNLKRDKGWIGQLLELQLGASAANLSEPDFQHLGIELKTIPLDARHQAKETTYVCVVPLINHIGLDWQDSCVFRKLSRVLWVPVEADPTIAIAHRRVGLGFLWSPSEQQMQELQDDWEEFMELISLGQVETISAHLGEHLQIRPKAANASAITSGIGANGLLKNTLPRGFYLRTSFTNRILQAHFSPD